MGLEVNEVDYGWHDLEFSYRKDGGSATITDGITALSYAHKTAVTNNYGTGRRPRSQSVGAYRPEESTMTFFKKEWEKIKADIGDGWQGAPFSLDVKYRNPGEPIHELAIQGRLQGESENLAEGDEAATVDVSYMPSGIRTNGIDPVRKSGA
jgi:hypothetical protein